MNLLKPLYIAISISLCISLNIYSQETLMYLQGYEEEYLPPIEKTSVTDTLYDRYLLFNPIDLESVDSLIFLYNGERMVIFNSSESGCIKDGRRVLQAGKTLASNEYSLAAYIKKDKTNPFIDGQEMGCLIRKPMETISDSTHNEEELIEMPLD